MRVTQGATGLLRRGRMYYSRAPKASRTPSELEIFWVAGFLEAEGTFSIAGPASESVAAVQANLEPLLRLQELLGGTIRPIKAKGATRPTYKWYAYGDRARGVALTLYELMSPKRRYEIEEVFRKLQPSKA